jgi:hypothetical protein
VDLYGEYGASHSLLLLDAGRGEVARMTLSSVEVMLCVVQNITTKTINSMNGWIQNVLVDFRENIYTNLCVGNQ